MTASKKPPVQSEVIGSIFVVTIDRFDEARNAVDGPTARALAEAFRAFDADERLHVAVVTGNGGSFCAGADLKAGTDPERGLRLEKGRHGSFSR